MKDTYVSKKYLTWGAVVVTPMILVLKIAPEYYGASKGTGSLLVALFFIIVGILLYILKDNWLLDLVALQFKFPECAEESIFEHYLYKRLRATTHKSSTQEYLIEYVRLLIGSKYDLITLRRALWEGYCHSDLAASAGPGFAYQYVSSVIKPENFSSAAQGKLIIEWLEGMLLSWAVER